MLLECLFRQGKTNCILVCDLTHKIELCANSNIAFLSDLNLVLASSAIDAIDAYLTKLKIIEEV